MNTINGKSQTACVKSQIKEIINLQHSMSDKIREYLDAAKSDEMSTKELFDKVLDIVDTNTSLTDVIANEAIIQLHHIQHNQDMVLDDIYNLAYEYAKISVSDAKYVKINWTEECESNITKIVSFNPEYIEELERLLEDDDDFINTYNSILWDISRGALLDAAVDAKMDIYIPDTDPYKMIL